MNIYDNLKHKNMSDPNSVQSNPTAMQMESNQSDPNAIRFDPDPIKNDMLNRSMFGNNYQQMTYDEKNNIYLEMLRFKCLD